MRITLPSCRFCGHPWLPSEDVNSATSYCPECRLQRRALAALQVASVVPEPAIASKYLHDLPRRHQKESSHRAGEVPKHSRVGKEFLKLLG